MIDFSDLFPADATGEIKITQYVQIDYEGRSRPLDALRDAYIAERVERGDVVTPLPLGSELWQQDLTITAAPWKPVTRRTDGDDA